MADIFISYSSKDRHLIKPIVRKLTARGWSVWWDTSIDAGTRYDDVIETELNKANCVLVVWSKNSIQSQWVKNEATSAMDQKKIIPLQIDKLTLPLSFSRLETAQLVNWSGASNHPEFKLVLKRIADLVGRAPVLIDNRTKYSEIFQNSYVWLRKKILILLPALIIAGVAMYFLLQQTQPTDLIIKVFDRNKIPLSDGSVKIYFEKGVRQQKLDREGQTVFNDILSKSTNKKTRIDILDVSGNIIHQFDTSFQKNKSLELKLSANERVAIGGIVENASHAPIERAEVSIPGTMYYTTTGSDGRFYIELPDFGLGDTIEVVITSDGYKDEQVPRLVLKRVITDDLRIVLAPL